PRFSGWRGLRTTAEESRVSGVWAPKETTHTRLAKEKRKRRARGVSWYCLPHARTTERSTVTTWGTGATSAHGRTHHRAKHMPLHALPATARPSATGANGGAA